MGLGQLPADERGGRVRRVGHPRPGRGPLAAVHPSPATHAILTLLEAGESVIQTLLVTKARFHALRGAEILFHLMF